MAEFREQTNGESRDKGMETSDAQEIFQCHVIGSNDNFTIFK